MPNTDFKNDPEKLESLLPYSADCRKIAGYQQIPRKHARRLIRKAFCQGVCGLPLTIEKAQE